MGKEDNGIIFRQRPDGKFSLNRTGNELLFDKLMLFTFCEKGVLSIYDSTGLISQGTFGKKSLTISEDKCRIDIKFEKYDEYSCLDSIADKEFNILSNYDGKPPMPIYSAKLQYFKNFEYTAESGNATINVVFSNNSWRNYNLSEPDHFYTYPDDTFVPSPINGSWTLYQNEYRLASAYSPTGNNYFDVTSYWVREVKLIMRLGAEQSETPTSAGGECDFYAWEFLNELVIDGVTYDKFVRKVEVTDFNPIYENNPATNDSPFIIKNDFICSGEQEIFTRCRKLNDIITTMIYDCFPDGFESQFFKNKTNPISGKDLSNILISQKSDCIFYYDEGTLTYKEPVDPATKGIITFKNLMEYLKSMFEVYWAIDENGKFRIEHKKYWDNNASYTVDNNIDNNVDIDLTVVYPIALIGTNEYSFEESIPIRERFTFMEAWNVDFNGVPISYENCVDSGEEISYSATQFTTDLEPLSLNNKASKEGFVVMNCNSTPDIDGTYVVISEVGKLSGLEVANAHLSWANLHDNYWKYGRYLPYGSMNSKQTDFEVIPLKYQKSISFPYCVSEFNPKKLIKTNLGNGIVRSASFSFKTNFITVELEYIDNL